MTQKNTKGHQVHSLEDNKEMLKRRYAQLQDLKIQTEEELFLTQNEITKDQFELYRSYVIGFFSTVYKYYPYEYNLVEKYKEGERVSTINWYNNPTLDKEKHFDFVYNKNNKKHKNIGNKSIYIYLKFICIDSTNEPIYDVQKNPQLKVQSFINFFTKIFDFSIEKSETDLRTLISLCDELKKTNYSLISNS